VTTVFVLSGGVPWWLISCLSSAGQLCFMLSCFSIKDSILFAFMSVKSIFGYCLIVTMLPIACETFAGQEKSLTALYAFEKHTRLQKMDPLPGFEPGKITSYDGHVYQFRH
jgi:hypothetical protein